MTEWSGLFESMPAAEYHRRELGVASKSALDLVTVSPAHYQAWVNGHDEASTPALFFGSAFHCALLEPQVFAETYACEPDFGDCRFKGNRLARDEWREAHAGATPISSGDMDKVRGMVASILQHRLAGRMIRSGKAEITARWTDEDTGLRCKARGDFYVPDLAMLLDVKTTLDASPRGFAKSVTNYGYDRQDAFYRAGFTTAGARVEHVAFVVVEKEPPYAVAVYQLSERFVERGHASIRRDMATLSECLKSNTFPGYPDGLTIIEPPRWAS